MATNVPMETITSKIYLIRKQKVMLDRDLAELYGIETRVLNQAVTRNIARFPNDFMFELTRDEIERISQIVISSSTQLVTEDEKPKKIYPVKSFGPTDILVGLYKM